MRNVLLALTFTLTLRGAWEDQFRQGHFTQAAHELEAALDQLTTDDFRTPTLLSNLGVVYRNLGRASDAERCYRQAIAFCERHPAMERSLAGPIENLAALELTDHRLTRARDLYRRAYEIRLRTAAPPDTLAASLQGLAQIAREQHHTTEAEDLYRQALASVEPESLKAAAITHNLGTMYAELGRTVDARPLFEKALAVYNPQHPLRAIVLRHLAEIEARDGHTNQAEALFNRAIEICRASLPPHHPDTDAILQSYARFLLQTKRKKEAGRVLATLGPETGKSYTVDFAELQK